MAHTIASTLRDAINWLRPISDSASLEAHLLLAEILGCDRAYLLAHGEVELTDEQLARFDAFIDRAAQGEPLAYLLGRRAFYDRDFVVTPAVLIPRPETETLLEAALRFANSRSALEVVDVGTGSGALAVTLAALQPAARVAATDISPVALAVARLNAEQQAAHVTFYEGDLLNPLIERGLTVDLVMANLPYIAADDLPALAVTRWEPRLALDGGVDGLDLIRRLLDQAPAVCRPGALVLLEIGSAQGDAVSRLALAALPAATVTVLPDLAGLDRVVSAVLPG